MFISDAEAINIKLDFNLDSAWNVRACAYGIDARTNRTIHCVLCSLLIFFCLCASKCIISEPIKCLLLLFESRFFVCCHFVFGIPKWNEHGKMIWEAHEFSFIILFPSEYLCVCVCVYMKKRNRYRERESKAKQKYCWIKPFHRLLLEGGYCPMWYTMSVWKLLKVTIFPDR